MKTKLDLSDVLNIPDLTSRLVDVNDQLVETLQIDNSNIIEPSKRLLRAGGKRLRPSLVIACSMVEGRKVDHKTLKLAASVELVHIGSLVHDDIIDRSKLRRKVATVNGQEGINHAIITGDYMLAKACQLASSTDQTAGVIVARTITDMCDGESRELADKGNQSRSLEAYYKSIEGKTASLIAAACELGGYSASMSDIQIKALGRYGHHFGLAFQMIDDLLDLLSTAELYGKPIGTDLTEGIYTLPILLGLQTTARGRIEQHLKTNELEFLVKQLLKTKSIKRTIEYIEDNIRKSVKALEIFNGPVAEALSQLPAYYLNWVINNQIANQYKASFLKMQKV